MNHDRLIELVFEVLFHNTWSMLAFLLTLSLPKRMRIADDDFFHKSINDFVVNTVMVLRLVAD